VPGIEEQPLFAFSDGVLTARLLVMTVKKNQLQWVPVVFNAMYLSWPSILRICSRYWGRDRKGLFERRTNPRLGTTFLKPPFAKASISASREKRKRCPNFADSDHRDPRIRALSEPLFGVVTKSHPFSLRTA